MHFFLCGVLLFVSQEMVAQEFIQQRKSKRISLQSIKEEAGDLFAQQLRESAHIVQLLGRVQLACLKNDAQTTYDMQRLKEVATQLRIYSLQLTDLLQPMVCTQAIYFSDTIGFKELIADLTTIIGHIQQHIINQLNGLIDDTSSLFIKMHVHALPGIVAHVKSYTPHLHALNQLLMNIEKKQQHATARVELNKQECLSNKSLPDGSLQNVSLVKS